MQVMYQSTRGKREEPVTASQAILKGLSEDGGSICTYYAFQPLMFPWKNFPKCLIRKPLMRL